MTTRALPALVALASLAFAVSPPAQDEAQMPALHVAYVGEPGTARADAFTRFLGDRFAEVDVFTRWKDEPAAFAGADVVVLDWPQGKERSIEWLRGLPRDERTSPLGARADWATPTVLLGSAGLNLAAAWDVRGGYG